MLDRFEREELVEEISKSLKIKKKKKENEEEKPEDLDDRFSFEIPLDEVLPPSHGHESGDRGMGSPHKSDFVLENIEDRLLRLLENVDMGADIDSSESANRSVDAEKDNRSGQKQVGTTEVLGHTKANKKPTTASQAQRQENSPFAARGKARQKEEKKGEESKGALEDAMEQMGVSGEAQTPE